MRVFLAANLVALECNGIDYLPRNSFQADADLIQGFDRSLYGSAVIVIFSQLSFGNY